MFNLSQMQLFRPHFDSLAITATSSLLSSFTEQSRHHDHSGVLTSLHNLLVPGLHDRIQASATLKNSLSVHPRPPYPHPRLHKSTNQPMLQSSRHSFPFPFPSLHDHDLSHPRPNLHIQYPNRRLHTSLVSLKSLAHLIGMWNRFGEKDSID